MSNRYVKKVEQGFGRGTEVGMGSNRFTSHWQSYFYGSILERDLGLQSQDMNSAYVFLDTLLNLG